MTIDIRIAYPLHIVQDITPLLLTWYNRQFRKALHLYCCNFRLQIKKGILHFNDEFQINLVLKYV